MSQDPAYNPYAGGSMPGMPQPVPAAKSGAVTAVAIMNFVFGALWLVCGLMVTLGGGIFAAFMPQIMEQAGKDPNMTEEQRQQLEQFGKIGGGAVGGIIMVIGIAMMLIGPTAIAAGIGVLKRRNWGRILTIVLGILAGLLALLSLSQLEFCSGIFYAIYAGTVLAILFNSRYAAEFV
jgi:hypothetical protein